ncbi:3-oxoacyl-ACP reductase [Brevibacillus reuszeri]|uniref:3-ketoacyl-ACP reductase n=1 Tax=Brevibacillus reuszeri TaxID=54915 RepID=A0A0K9Z1M1_9BACL|nr:SDR family oxidoreductase [Brevibacillus reuszeri]KNB74848.1 3-ketoacyl-ACP reductase [Brevibacillus reuszeri]MED1859501.1 SDR family NAD(P)-dependent oxidoreductase [Brevibacillus reuszeri]GED71999.1 3-oxoacyl-ACP reductase [Brevibacillus reuszeri]
MLQNKTIIVTGAASGIGAEITHECLKEGATVIACDIDLAGLESLHSSLPDSPLYIHQVDVSSYEQVQDLFAFIHKSGLHPTGLVNNAGIYLGKSLLSYELHEIDRVLAINIKGYVYFSKLFGSLLLEQKKSGSIVNMASVSGQEGSSDAVYGLSKAAILGLTKSCAMNFSPFIRVNAVCPTLVDTPMMDQVPAWRKTEYQEHGLIKEPVTAKDVAHTVTFLLSAKAKHYTGATFDLNNGCYLR